MPRESTPSTQSIGNYIFSKVLGQGTFGKVKLGTHVPTGEKVAVKILEKRKIQDSDDVERVSRELRILRQVRHPNIVRLYETIETTNHLFLIMEYAEGGELFDHIVANKKLGEDQACAIYQQILAALEYLHGHGVVHRDLKPENILLDAKHNVKLVDFGLSNTYKPLEQLKTACGSPCYAAPEMVAGRKYSPCKTDIWSSGIVLYALLCGFLPFEDPNTRALYKKIIAGQYQCPQWVSREAKDLLSRVLHTNPSIRASFTQIKAHLWYNRIPPVVHGGYADTIDEGVLNQLRQYGIDPEQTRVSLENHKHNQQTTTYFLLLKKQQPFPNPGELKAPPRADTLRILCHRKGESSVYPARRTVDSSGRNRTVSPATNRDYSQRQVKNSLRPLSRFYRVIHHNKENNPKLQRSFYLRS